MNTEFTTMQYNQRFLVIKNDPDKNAVVIAECYLPETAATICELLTDAAQIETNDTTKLNK